MRSKHQSWVKLAVVCGALALGCGGGGGGGGPAPAPDPAAPGGDETLATAVSLSPLQPAPGTQVVAAATYTMGAPERLGAYLAEIRFDPALIRFVSADQSMEDDRVLNTLKAERGTIVVAGASSGGFVDGVLFKGTFEALAPGVTPATLRLKVVEATDTRLRNVL